jgi:hypothetical protein
VKRIDIDLDVNRAIENGRSTFDEDQNAILRRLLGIDTAPRGGQSRPMPRTPRSSGAYSTVVDGRPVEANSLKDLLRRVILVCAKGRRGFLRALGEVTTRRGRRMIAMTPAALYPQTPHLARYAEKLNEQWWYDTNIGRDQVAAYFKIIAKLAGLAHIPAISKRSEKTTQTPEDLGL